MIWIIVLNSTSDISKQTQKVNQINFSKKKQKIVRQIQINLIGQPININKIVAMPRINYFKLRESHIKDNIFGKSLAKLSRPAFLMEQKISLLLIHRKPKSKKKISQLQKNSILMNLILQMISPYEHSKNFKEDMKIQWIVLGVFPLLQGYTNMKVVSWICRKIIIKVPQKQNYEHFKCIQ